MTHFANRTDDWPRLVRADLFKVTDEPGRITCSLTPVAFFIFLLPTVAVGLFCLTGLFSVRGLGSLMTVAFLLAVFFLPLLMATLRRARVAYRVTFLADRVEFYGPLGLRHGSLSRESLQQITVHKEEVSKPNTASRLTHQFIADTGWIYAFPTHNASLAMLRNNLLMSAFAQPIDMDRAA